MVGSCSGKSTDKSDGDKDTDHTDKVGGVLPSFHACIALHAFILYF